MTDQTTPANLTRKEAQAVREWAERAWNTKVQDATVAHAARVLLAVLPPRPTLADMTDDERDACRWMQADVRDFDRRMVVAEVRTTTVGLIEKDGTRWNAAHGHVTPRPDLPRMEWPDTEKPAPAPALPDGWRLAEHPKNGRVIVTNPTPARDGRVYYVLPSTDPRGCDWLWCDPAELTYLDGPTTKGAGTTTGPNDVAVGTVIESADDPRLAALPVGSILLDRDGDTTTKRRRAWTGDGYVPNKGEGDKYGPWTVLHIPKENTND